MILNLQLLRAVAALLVVFVHVDRLLAPWGLTGGFGYGGVDVFFVISGFIMVHVSRRRPPRPAEFFINRLVRVAPIYWLLTLAVFTLVLLAPNLLGATRADPIELIKSLAFIPFTKANGLVEPVLFVGWTLNYEMFFYVLFAVGLFAPFQVGVLGCTAVLAGLVAAGALLHPAGALWRFYTSPVLLEFGAGMAIALLRPHLPSAAGAASRWAVLALAAAALLAVAGLPALAPGAPRLITTGAPAALLVLAAITLERWGWRATAPLLVLIGDASYSLYLTHPFVTQAMQKLLLKAHASGAVSLAALPLTLLAVTVVGVSFFRGVERPLTGWARARFTRKPAPACAPKHRELVS